MMNFFSENRLIYETAGRAAARTKAAASRKAFRATRTPTTTTTRKTVSPSRKARGSGPVSTVSTGVSQRGRGTPGRPSVRSISARATSVAQTARGRQQVQRDAVAAANKRATEAGSSTKFKRVQAFARNETGEFTLDAKGNKIIIPFATEIIRTGDETTAGW